MNSRDPMLSPPSPVSYSIARLLIAVLATVSMSFAAMDALNPTDRRSIDIKATSLWDLVTQLSVEFRTAICLESLTTEPLPRTRGGDDLHLTLTLTNVNVQEAVAALVARNSLYTWKLDDTNEMITVIPVKDSRLNWQIPHLEIKEKTPQQIFDSEDLLGLHEHGIIFVQPPGNTVFTANPRLSVVLDNVDLLTALNRISVSMTEAAGVPSSMGFPWQVSALPPEPPLIIPSGNAGDTLPWKIPIPLSDPSRLRLSYGTLSSVSARRSSPGAVMEQPLRARMAEADTTNAASQTAGSATLTNTPTDPRVGAPIPASTRGAQP